MLWLFALPFVVLIGTAVLCVPYGAVRQARRNTRRSGGARSTRRTRREVRHGALFLWRTLGRPSAALLLALSGMLAFHHYGMPDSTLAELFGENHPEVALHSLDIEAWKQAIEARQRDEAYRRWKQAQGLESPDPPSALEQFSQHWPAHVVFLLLAWGFVLAYAVRVTPRSVAAYRSGVRNRAREYHQRDLEDAPL